MIAAMVFFLVSQPLSLYWYFGLVFELLHLFLQSLYGVLDIYSNSRVTIEGLLINKKEECHR